MIILLKIIILIIIEKKYYTNLPNLAHSHEKGNCKLSHSPFEIYKGRHILAVIPKKSWYVLWLQLALFFLFFYFNTEAHYNRRPQSSYDILYLTNNTLSVSQTNGELCMHDKHKAWYMQVSSQGRNETFVL